jgi:hypothetical protein
MQHPIVVLWRFANAPVDHLLKTAWICLEYILAEYRLAFLDLETRHLDGWHDVDAGINDLENAHGRPRLVES